VCAQFVVSFQHDPHFRAAGHGSRSGDGGEGRRAIRGKQIRGTRFIRRRATNIEEELAEKESQLATGEITRDELESMKTALAQLTEAAQTATAKRERAELEAAEANLRRQQKLLKLGIGQKSDVTRAEEKLAELKAQNNR
jgi:hypothetical protein